MIRLGEFIHGNGNYSQVLITRSDRERKRYCCLVFDRRRCGWFVASDGSLAAVRRAAKEYLKEGVQ